MDPQTLFDCGVQSRFRFNICIIGDARGPHAGELICANCGQHRGWLSKTTAAWIENVITRFGAPTTPIVVRKAHTFEEEAPPEESTPH